MGNGFKGKGRAGWGVHHGTYILVGEDAPLSAGSPTRPKGMTGAVTCPREKQVLVNPVEQNGSVTIRGINH